MTLIFLGVLLAVLGLLYFPAKMVKGMMVESYCDSQARKLVPDSENKLVPANAEEKKRYKDMDSIYLSFRKSLECVRDTNKQFPLSLL